MKLGRRKSEGIKKLEEKPSPEQRCPSFKKVEYVQGTVGQRRLVHQDQHFQATVIFTLHSAGLFEGKFNLS